MVSGNNFDSQKVSTKGHTDQLLFEFAFYGSVEENFAPGHQLETWQLLVIR